MSEFLSDIELAELRASVYAPRQAYEPLYAGGAGMAVVGLVLLLFTGFAGVDPDHFLFATVTTLGLGFALPYLYFWDQRRRHTNACLNELARVQREKRETLQG